MLVALAVILAALWFIGIAVSYTVGGLIHVLLVLAIVTLAYHFFTNSVSYEDPRQASIL